MHISYYTTSVLHLSLEDFHNAGLTPGQTKEIIESIYDPGAPNGTGFKLACKSSGLNNNWNVSTSLRGKHDLANLVMLIRYKLSRALGLDVPYPDGAHYAP